MYAASHIVHMTKYSVLQVANSSRNFFISWSVSRLDAETRPGYASFRVGGTGKSDLRTSEAKPGFQVLRLKHKSDLVQATKVITCWQLLHAAHFSDVSCLHLLASSQHSLCCHHDVITYWQLLHAAHVSDAYEHEKATTASANALHVPISCISLSFLM